VNKEQIQLPEISPPTVPETTYMALGGVGVANGWGKTSRSGIMECVETRAHVQEGEMTAVETRDSKFPEGPTLTFPAESWLGFMGEIR
jgi:hypothetical protein